MNDDENLSSPRRLALFRPNACLLAAGGHAQLMLETQKVCAQIELLDCCGAGANRWQIPGRPRIVNVSSFTSSRIGSPSGFAMTKHLVTIVFTDLVKSAAVKSLLRPQRIAMRVLVFNSEPSRSLGV
jgi:hypothetical protein